MEIQRPGLRDKAKSGACVQMVRAANGRLPPGSFTSAVPEEIPNHE
jgi:hypothetical protein